MTDPRHPSQYQPKGYTVTFMDGPPEWEGRTVFGPDPRAVLEQPYWDNGSVMAAIYEVSYVGTYGAAFHVGDSVLVLPSTTPRAVDGIDASPGPDTSTGPGGGNQGEGS